MVRDNKLPDNKVLLEINKRALNALKSKLNAAQEFSSSARIKLAKILNLDAEFEELNSSVWNEKKAIFIEWPEKVIQFLPEETVWISIHSESDNTRTIILDYEYRS